jgi:Rad52/22 family double-strand break repair protein
MRAQEEIEKILSRPLPAEAIKPPNNKGLSSIKTIYVTDRLNEAFGVGCWTLNAKDMGAQMWMQKTKSGEREMYTAKMHVRITLPNGSYYECVATSQNDDEGDASKGAISDCASKIGSWLGIGAHIWRGQSQEQAWAEWNAKYPPAKKEPTLAEAKESATAWCYKVLPNSHRDYRTEIARAETVQTVKSIMADIKIEVDKNKEALSNAPA